MSLKALYYPDVPFESLFIPYIYKEIYLDGIYTDIFNGKKDIIVIDAGANIGVVTQYMRDFSKKVYAVEPSPEHFEALEKNKKFNKWDNVEVFNLAFADQDGEMDFNINTMNRTCNSLVHDKTRGMGYTEDAIKVKTMRFDTFFKENKLEDVDFVKFDVEGAEDMILRSESFRNIASRIKAIEVEFHHNDWMDLVKYMTSLGYQARRYDCSAIVVLFYR